MSLFRKSFMETGPKRPKRQNGEQKQIGGPTVKRRRKPLSLYRVICKVTKDEGDDEYFYDTVSVGNYAQDIFDENQDVGEMKKMSGPPQNIYGKTPFLVETKQYFGEAKFGSEFKFCLFNYKDLYEEIKLLSTLTENILWPAKLIQWLDYHKARLFNDISPELLMVSVELFNQLDSNSRRRLADMFDKIYVISFLDALDE